MSDKLVVYTKVLIEEIDDPSGKTMKRVRKTLKDWIKRYEEMAQIIGETYQVVGVLSAEADRFDDVDVNKVMDNLSDQELIHTDVLPFNAKAKPKKVKSKGELVT